MSFTTVPGAAVTDATTLVGTSGNDTVNVLNETKKIFAGAQGGNDIIRFGNGQFVSSGFTFKGGSGEDLIAGFDTSSSLKSSFINLNAGNDESRLYDVNTSTVKGGKGVDTINISRLESSILNGNKGNDILESRYSSAASIYGGKGADNLNLFGSHEGSTISSDDDGDTITLNTGASIVNTIIDGGKGNDSVVLAAITSFLGSSNIKGGDGNDTINAAGSAVGITSNGNAGNDSASGSSVVDALTGGSGNDTLSGNAGADVLSGGEENDTLTGGADNDTLTGGTGLNTFVFADSAANNGLDTITDFNVSNGDILNTAAFMTSDGGVEALAANAQQALSGGTDDDIFVVDFAANINGKDFGGGQFTDLFGAGKAFVTTNPAAAINNIIYVQGTDETQAYSVTDAGGAVVAAGDVTQIGLLTGLTNATAIVDANVV